MLVIFLEACALIGLLKVINDEDAGLLAACGLALGGAIGTNVAISGLYLAMGIAGIPVGAIIAAGLLGVAISAIYGVEIKRSFLISGLFVVIHVVVLFGLGFARGG